MAVIYEVELDAEADVAEAMLAWLPGHVAALLALPGFESAVIEERHDPPPTPGRRVFCCRYRLTDRAALDRYLAEDAQRMRADGQTRFGGHFQARRRVLTVRHRQSE